MVRNPKLKGTVLFECIPQVGPCPVNCNQCFYNRPNAFYVPTDKPHIPSPEEIGKGIVRLNTGHDSNIQRDLVIETAKQYKYFFFNTSIPRFDFPGPVVFTANPKEEEEIDLSFLSKPYKNLMFVRIRTSSTNLKWVDKAIKEISLMDIPIVLTFMAYYENNAVPDQINYVWRKRHLNQYWCPTQKFKTRTIKTFGNRLVTMCGTPKSNWCKDCRNCETYYWQTKKRLGEI